MCSPHLALIFVHSEDTIILYVTSLHCHTFIYLAVSIPVYRSVLSFHPALASPDRRGTSRREGERDVQTVGGGMQFRMKNRCGS